MGLFDNFIKKKLKREDLLKWYIDNYKNAIENKKYLDFLNMLEQEINRHSFKTDKRYVTYGRKNHLKQEFYDQIIYKKGFYENECDGALFIIEQFISEINFFRPFDMPEAQRKEFRKIDQKNSEYYKSGIICKEEKENILEMINYLKKYIENTKYVIYEFIPYKKIGPINLDKEIQEQDFKPNGVPYLYENSVNHVLCRPIVIAHPDIIDTTIRRNSPLTKIYIEYNNKKIEITCLYEQFMKNLKEICDDLIIKETNSSTNNVLTKWKEVRSDKLGITFSAEEINKEFYIQALVFLGKESYKQKIEQLEEMFE